MHIHWTERSVSPQVASRFDMEGDNARRQVYQYPIIKGIQVYDVGIILTVYRWPQPLVGGVAMSCAIAG